MADDSAPRAPAAEALDATASPFQTLHEIVREARKNLNPADWDYVAGGAETETTLRRNRLALDSVAFRPRVLRDVSAIDATVEQFGRRLRLPVMLAPVGSMQSLHRDAAAAVVRAAGRFGVAHMVSSVTQPGLEGVAAASPEALRIFQLYVRGDDDFVEDHIQRAIAHGYTAFCLTVDSAYYSRRERDIAKRHVVLSRQGVTGMEFQAALDWRTVKLVRDRLKKMPLILKGIVTAEDARIALDHGVDWIYVTNHGGRQLDHGRGSFDVLPEIVGAVAGRARIMVDGSICRGTDIIKAIAAGADLVGIGRLQCFGLAAAGQAGVTRVLELLEDEILRSLGQLGVTRFAELDRSFLHPAPPVHPPHVLSAFPLLKIEEQFY